jgi:3-(3-hydroxy-phenyl)propionate hydroxylase/6-hydroxy-3-succinoylpyridine 3-monooxygenase
VSEDTDVVVVGAGPVGLLTALGLARAGVSVRVLEAGPGIEDSPRAIVYHWTVLEELARLGILHDAKARGICKTDYAYRVFETGEMIRYSIDILADETPYAYNLHLGQHELGAIALEHLSGHANAAVQWNAEVLGLSQDDTGVTVSTQNDQYRTGWMIGADGARSTVRKLLGIPFDGVTWPERFVATNVFYDFQSHGYARANFLIHDVHGAVIVKIDERDLWRVTYSEDGALAVETVGERIAGHYRWLLPDPHAAYEVARHQPYRMHQRAAGRFRAGRVLLAGDAAHASNPTGGLGLTSGLFDSFALTGALASVVLEGTDPALLDRWAAERRRIFLEIASPAASENKRVVYSEPDPERRRADLEEIRRSLSDPDALRERLKFTERLRSEPLPDAQR